MNNHRLTPILFLIILFSLLTLNSCGSDSDYTDARVVDASLRNRTIRVGESSILSLGIEYADFSLDPFNNPEDISLLVKLPNGTKFREGTAEIQRTVDDDRIDPTITNCDQTGEQYLDFRIDGDDLRRASNPSGRADVEINLTIDAISPIDIGIIQAKADKDRLPFACNAFFASDSEESIQILP